MKGKPKQNQHNYKKKRREREVKNKEKILYLLNKHTCKLTKWFSMFVLLAGQAYRHAAPPCCHMLQRHGSQTAS